MRLETPQFKEKSRKALADPQLRRALETLQTNFSGNRGAAIGRLPEFDALRDRARAIKDHTLANLDYYLEAWEGAATAAGAKVHWARGAGEAKTLIADLCRAAGARTVVKAKSMIGEEIGLNPHLEAEGLEIVETDLGEYIVQLAGEPPSHIIGPAVHKTVEQVADLFHERHAALGHDRKTEGAALVGEAREVLREAYFRADLAITGANLLVAETGSIVIVTNEGNADLAQGLARVHIVLASLEKPVPNLDDAATVLRVLARSATGQEMAAYTTLVTGPRRAGESDGPEELHVVLVDNGRAALLGTEFREVLRCIRCGACMNHCPVYGAVGGHAYGWVYPGPIGAVLTPAFVGVEAGRHLPNASSFCGRCAEVCPMRIPLPDLMRRWRAEEFTRGLAPPRQRWALAMWSWAARRPRLYRLGARLAARALAALAGRRGRLRRLPGAAGWTQGRDLPAPEGATFQARWARTRAARAR